MVFKKILLLLTLSVLGLGTKSFAGDIVSLQNGDKATVTVENHQNISNDIKANEEEVTEKGEEEEGGMEPLFFIIIALVIGAGVRHFFRKVPLPFTVILLIFGIGLGLLNRFELFSGWGETISKSLVWAAHINPHAILFVFLPILIFEAAFGMDLHTFKKTAVNSIILAVPGIMIALVLSAGLVILLKVMNIGLFSWGWVIALMFGSVISATDPVAVVALLKELGASKKLGTLIEGESLLNDGTAIVFFMVFFTAVTGATAENSAVVEFFRVSFGGLLVGLIIAGIVIAWVKRVFNDVLVEMSVIIVAAYLTFFVAEHFMHMSGVLALVALGLAMVGVGKTRISPEVEHFLHEFWELAGFIANVLIFIIVGVIIAQRVEFTANDFLVLGIFYVGLHIVRGIMIIMLYPIMKRIGYGINRSEATILWYGALRGAIALALALVVLGVDDKFISPEIKSQFFFITAGVVTLTLLINATTIKFIVDMLGLSKIAPAKAMMIHNANQYLRTSTENAVERLKKDRFISNANWSTVKDYLPNKVNAEKIEGIEVEAIAEMRKRVLEKEKSSYWSQFKDGLLGPVAVQILSSGIDEILDEGGMVSLSKRKDLELLLNTPKLLSRMQSLPLLKRITRNRFFEKLAISYDCARGFVDAQEEAIKLVESIGRSLDENDKEGEKSLANIEIEINENKIQGLTFIRNLRKTYPEIYDAIATRQAIRSMLNYELKTIERLHKNGRIDSGEANKMIHSVEIRMKKLLLKPPKAKIPEIIELMQEIPWLQDINLTLSVKMRDFFKLKIFSVGDKIIKEGATDKDIYIITRGTAQVTVNDEPIDVLGHGSVVGEISALTGCPRTTTVTAESPVTALWMSLANLKEILNESEELQNRLWKFAAMKITENLLRNKEPYNVWRPKEFQRWLKKGELNVIKENQSVEIQENIIILIHGKASVKETEIASPAIIEGKDVKGLSDAKIFILPKPE